MTMRTSDSRHRPFLYSRVCFVVEGMPLWPWLDFEWWLCNSYSRRKLVLACRRFLSRECGRIACLLLKKHSPVFDAGALPEHVRTPYQDDWKPFLMIDTCHPKHRPPQRSALLAYFSHNRSLGITHCWRRLRHSPLFIYSCWYCTADV